MKVVPHAVASEWEKPTALCLLTHRPFCALDQKQTNKNNPSMAPVTIIFRISRKILSVLTTSVLHVIYWISALPLERNCFATL